MKTDIYNVKNEKVGQMELPDELFCAKWNPTVVAQVARAMQANIRRPWAHAKGRAEVRGGGRKPWRQKGTGRARHGSIRSPLWSGGGKAHGPNKERDYSQKINKKMKRAAFIALMSRKVHDKEFRVFDSLAIDEPKTKLVFLAMKGILNLGARAKKLDVLIVPGLENKNMYKATRNLVKAKATHPQSLSVMDLLSYKNIFVEKEAVGTIVKTFGKSSAT